MRFSFQGRRDSRFKRLVIIQEIYKIVLKLRIYENTLSCYCYGTNRTKLRAACCETKWVNFTETHEN